MIFLALIGGIVLVAVTILGLKWIVDNVNVKKGNENDR